MMKQTSIVLAAALLLAMPCLAIADDPPAGQTQTPQAQAQAQTPQAQTQTPQAQTPPPAQEPAKPTPKIEKMTMPEGPPAELKKLSTMKGSWTSSMHMYESPMGPESTSPSKATFDWAYTRMRLEGNHHYKIGEKQSFGRSSWGWDPEKQQYQLIWSDAMFPTSFVYYGTFTNDNTLVMHTTYMMQGKAVTEKMTFAFPNPDNYTMTMECDMTGEMKLMMEEKGTRAKGAAKTASKSAKTKTTTQTTTKKSG
jgi:hypothetical protein